MMIPAIGEIRTQAEISTLARASSFEIERIGNPIDGGMLLILRRPSQAISSSWLLVVQNKKMFKRVY